MPVATFAACGYEPDYSCADAGEDPIADVMNSDLEVEESRPLGEVVSELTVGLVADLTDYMTNEPLGRGRIRLEFAEDGVLKKRRGCEGPDQTAEIDAVMFFETESGERIAQTETITFSYNGYFELEYLGLGSEGEVASAFWSLLGQEPGEPAGSVNANCRFSPVTECAGGAFLDEYEDERELAIVGRFAVE